MKKWKLRERSLALLVIVGMCTGALLPAAAAAESVPAGGAAVEGESGNGSEATVGAPAGDVAVEGESAAAESGSEPGATDVVQTGNAATESKSAAAASETSLPAQVSGREEVIYAILGNNGAVRDIYSVNILDVTSPGKVTDYGRFDAVRNLTDTNAVTYDDGEVHVEAGRGRLYYQGNMSDKNLPWDVSIEYTLDGKTVAPDALAGASGHLIIDLWTTKNRSVDSGFFDNYMLQISMTLDDEKCSSIDAGTGTLANAGSDKLVSSVIMPGKNGHLTVSADVDDFEMAGISIAAVPFSMDVDVGDFSNMTDGLTQMSDAIRQLTDGAAQLKSGTAQLSSGAASLKSGAGNFSGGLSALSGNSDSLAGYSSQIRDALNNINGALSGVDTSKLDLTALAALPTGLDQLADGLDAMAAGMGSLSEGFGQALVALEGAVAAIPEASVTEADIGGLMAANPDNGALGALIANYQAAQTVKGTYGAVAPAFAAVRDQLPLLADNATAMAATLRDISGQISGSMTDTNLTEAIGQLKDGIGQLADQYGGFHEGLVDYTQGVKNLAGGFGQLSQGINSLASGIDNVNGGMGNLANGLDTLNENTRTLPDEIQTAINEKKDEYDTSDFTPVSFVSPRNANVTSVQFVIQTEGITKPEVKLPAAPPEEKNVWTRLKDLFTGE